MSQLSLYAANRSSNIVLQMPEEPGDLTTALQHIVRLAQTTFTADVCTICAFHPIKGRCISSFTLKGNQIKENRPVSERTHTAERSKRQSITRQVLKQGELLVEDLSTVPQYQTNFARTHHIRAFAALALRTRHQHKSLGVLYISFREPRIFHDDECERLHTFVSQASFILQETWLLQRYQAVAEIGQDINLAFENIDVLFEKLQARMADILDTSHLLLAVHELPTKTLELYSYEHGHCNHQTRLLEGIYKQVIESGEPLFIRALSRDESSIAQQIRACEKSCGESLLFQPLKFRDVVLGVLSVQHMRSYAYSQEDQFVLQLLANHIALAVHNMRLYSGLKRMNETGRLLAQQLDSEQVLQSTTEKILQAADADLVVLYPYESTAQHARVFPHIAGQLINQTVISAMFPKRSDDIAALLIQRQSPIFARESVHLYQELGRAVEDVSQRFAGREQIRSIAALPLCVMDEVVGVLFVNFRQSQRFDSPQKILIEGLAHFAGIAIKNAQIFGTMSRRHEREAEILRNVDRELSRDQNLDLEQTLRIILTLANELLQADKASILLHDTYDQVLRAEVHIGPAVAGRAPFPIPLLHTSSSSPIGITRWVFEHKQSACVHNVRCEQPWCDLYIPTVVSTISELDVPLLDGDEVIGVFNFESAREGAFLQEDQNFLLTLAGQVVIAVKNAQVYEREKRLADEGQTLNDISKEIVSQLNHLRIFDLIIEKALLLTGSANGVLMLHDQSANTLFCVAESGLPHSQRWKTMKVDQGLVGYAARTKTLLNVDPEQSLWKNLYVEFVAGTRSELVVPMLANGGVLRGVINIESPIPGKYNQRDERLMKGLADLAVIALQNNELFEKAERDATRFSLLYRAGKELSNIGEREQLDRAYETIVNFAEEHSKSLVILRILEEETQELVVKQASQGHAHDVLPRINLNEYAPGVALRERRTLRIDDTHRPPAGLLLRLPIHSPIQSAVITPIQFNDRDYGVLILASEAISYFRDADIPFFEGLAQQLASTIYRIETVQERQEFERRAFAAEVMSTIGQSAYELTHRLGNGLGLVESYVDTIRAELDMLHVNNSEVSKMLDNIVQDVRPVLTLSSSLKHDLANLKDPGKVNEPFALVSPQSLFKEIRKQLPLLPSITLSVEVEPGIGRVRVIRRLVLDILYNLVNNAIDAMPAGGHILLRARNDGRSVVLEVADNGPGIPEPQKSKVFELFFSSKGSSGFGLWSARQNALRNHGVLDVRSEPGRGATFTLFLPRIESEDEYWSEVSP